MKKIVNKTTFKLRVTMPGFNFNTWREINFG